MLISTSFFIKLQQIAKTNLKYKEIANETSYIHEMDNLLHVRPAIYYRRLGMFATNFNWEEPRTWNRYAKENKLMITQIKEFQLFYGVHKNKKYATGFVIPYQEPVSLIETSKILDKLFKSHVKKEINKQSFTLYDDKTNHVLVIINLYQSIKKESTHYAKSNYAKSSTVRF